MIKKKKKILALFGNFEKEIDSLQLFFSQFREQALAEAMRLHEQNMKHPQSSPEVNT